MPAKSAQLAYRRDLGPDLAVFRFELEGGVPPFQPGQFIVLGLSVDERVLWRPYSIASSPEERRFVELYIRRVRGPKSRGFTAALWLKQLGDVLQWKPLRGAFTFDDLRPDGSPYGRRQLLIAAGTGLAPFVSHLLHVEHEPQPPETVLCHGASYVSELGYRERLLELERRALERGWAFRYVPTISRPTAEPNAGWEGHVGRVEDLLKRSPTGARSPVEAVIGEELRPQSTSIWVCGFQGTVDAVLALLEPMGFKTRRHPRADGSFDVRSESYG